MSTLLLKKVKTRVHCIFFRAFISLKMVLGATTGGAYVTRIVSALTNGGTIDEN
jgi:hypothetical protein